MSEKDKKCESKTGRIKVSRMMCGATCGKYGIPCYAREGENPSLYGLDLQGILGMYLWDEAEVEVSVRLIKRGKKRVNPWRKNSAYYRNIDRKESNHE